MPNPKHRFSKTRTAKRRTHYKLEAPTFIICTNCGTSVLYHRVSLLKKIQQLNFAINSANHVK